MPWKNMAAIGGTDTMIIKSNTIRHDAEKRHSEKSEKMACTTYRMRCGWLQPE
ncbi:hypothetical protein [Luteibacter aegosomatissinici]|uniref:hypothetical protein n=1 Tax=Luteibacter aegosomatissinici TaxID=2911539 RepID=UPI001FFAB98A|nr:hypothetical protein [Luteibacter aegosomatissinici]UPG95814.1 hypothetical protein L2Y97_06805 [Luteibacter aegosomatissinici]